MKSLLINNHDSFVYNIVQITGSLGYEMDVVMNEDLDHLDPEKYEKIIISPGPGNPENYSDRGKILEFLKSSPDSHILGICFGHQTLAYYLGSSIRVMDRPLHGEIDRIMHMDSPLYKGIPESFRAVRYHSLTVIPSERIVVDALSSRDGSVMGFHTKEGHIFGIQFHPESFYTEYGREIIKNFMEVQ